MADKLRMGVIGVGGMGSGHCSMIPAIPELELTAVCDIDEATRLAVSAKHSVPSFDRHTALLDSGLVDAVLIATPHYFHAPIAVDAFSRGLHVLSEKPVAVTVGAADEMASAARAANRAFGVMYQMRSEPQYLAARKIVESGAVGDIYRTSCVMGWYRSQAYYNSGGWRATWRGEGGGVLINQAPHLLDAFTWLGGLPARVTGQTRTRLHDIEVEDEAFAVLEYPNGAHGYLYASTTETPDTMRIEICGDVGKLVISHSELKFSTVDKPIREFTFENQAMWAGPGTKLVDVPQPKFSDLSGHAAITQNFARHILFGDTLLAPGYDGLNAVELFNSIILSGKSGETVSVPVDRARYDALIADLQAGSREKQSATQLRETDPKFA
ncbi:MAG: Gfo/Idh/MocA family oxidoreductase [Armatimonadetes bacterium]|nr:Gfo/Idh/MocA family oxidoreductase [Armatimonadota bacterium]MDE2207939.1 Gfo/Idh/MocA family oxidoreductase [Armatimonadota bacterium]